MMCCDMHPGHSDTTMAYLLDDTAATEIKFTPDLALACSYAMSVVRITQIQYSLRIL